MTNGWSLYIIVGTLGTLLGTVWFLLANRTKEVPQPGTTGHDFDGIEELDTPLPRWWVGLFMATIVFALGYLVYYPGLGSFPGLGDWTSTEQWSDNVAAQQARFAPLYAEIAALPPEQLMTDRRAQQIGRRLYLNNCATCHGLTAQGAFGFPNLTDGEWLWGGSLKDIETTIRQGRTGAMAPWGPALGDEGVLEVANYVLSLSGQKHDPALAERGAKRFATLCVACHGPDGKGNPVLGAPDLTNNIWLYGGSLDQIAFTIRNGRSGVMPAHLELLGPDRTHILAAYIASLSADGD